MDLSPGLHNIYNGLIGQWSIKRDISDTGTYKGHAVFTVINDRQLTYREDGVLWIDHGREVAGYRDFIYHFHGNIIDIIFNDGPSKGENYNHFIFENDNMQAHHIHYCGNDQYKCDFIFNNPQSFQIQTHIIGPKKNSKIITEYTRVTDQYITQP